VGEREKKETRMTGEGRGEGRGRGIEEEKR